ncbi:uncharacterized protein LOC134177801 [Corticium candelabrum]|uniref:uncharacterized protein LOC134177801 n=1 Tax=Corticium candelabrum TaxID=121492 RepID=UPI002E2679EA|nr:uncharacterized protein LOC134177801 [Corticium candelabrum]
MNNSTKCSPLIDWMDVDWAMISMLSNSTSSKWKAQYLFSGLFSGFLFLLALVALFQSKSTFVRNMNRSHTRSVVCYFYTLQVLIAVMGLSRFLVHTVNYATDGRLLDKAVEAVLSGFSHPCITSGSCLLFIVLLQSVMRLRQLRWMTKSCLCLKAIFGICLVHFAVSITGHLLVKYNIEKSLNMQLCYSFFVAWAGFLFLGFPIVGCYLRRGAQGLHRSSISEALPGATLTMERQTIDTKYDIQYRRLVILTSISSATGFVLCVLYTFALVQTVICDIGSDISWWCFSLVTRLVEFTLATLLLFSTVKLGKEGMQLYCCYTMRSTVNQPHNALDRKCINEYRHCKVQEIKEMDSTPEMDNTPDKVSSSDSGVFTPFIPSSLDEVICNDGKLTADSLSSSQPAAPCKEAGNIREVQE